MKLTNLPSVTVSQLNGYIKTMFDADRAFASVVVSGEISNFSPHYKTGHLYFSLKDDASAIKAVMFASQASRLRFRPENGMKVYALGRVGVFERDGVYQIYVSELVPDGEGALAAAFRQLRERLEKKGLFDPAHKKPLPPYPKKIGVVTSPGGAALQDVLNILGRRWPFAEVILAGVTVQGPNAPYEMIGALRELNEKTDADVIILCRGGGSAEDLWCFNDEGLAWAIYESRIPVVSAVGHETDYSISDLVADLRAPTPSAAAELTTPDIRDLAARTASYDAALRGCARRLLAEKRERLALLTARWDLAVPGAFFRENRARLSALTAALSAEAEKNLGGRRERLSLTDGALRVAARQTTTAARLRWTQNAAALEKLDPMQVLRRGYAVVTGRDGILESVGALAPGMNVEIRFRDGAATATVTGIGRRESDGKNDV